MQDLHQVAAQDLDVGNEPARVTEKIGAHPEALSAGAIDQEHAFRSGVCSPHLARDPHSLHDLAGGSPNVDRLAALARGRCLFDDRHLEAAGVQPVGKCGAGDAGAGYQYAGCLHCHVLLGRVLCTLYKNVPRTLSEHN